MTDYAPTSRTQVRRLPKRASYDRATVHAILDEAFICHVGFVADGSPVTIPTAFGRAGEQIYIHGSAGSRMLRAAAKGTELCVTVTLLDGLVLARSAFHHSINYRSVVIFGRGEAIEDAAGKAAALEAFFARIHPGRWADVRWPNPQELKATAVVRVPIDEASAKIRKGGPLDDAEDMALPVWAGVVPLTIVRGEPVRHG
jgi:nitroimidazol reductase NimA-like FMN-containing flavoprotein (pyridoxamine 5'-phosphate oxidase superfamily)